MFPEFSDGWQITDDVWYIILALLCSTTVGVAEITVTPENFTIRFDQSGTPVGNLTILCQPPSHPDDLHVSFIQLSKRTESMITPILSLSQLMNGGYPVKERGVENRKFIYSGQISKNSSSSFLRLEYADASCLDEGTFLCIVTIWNENSSASESLTYSANILSQTMPGKALLLQSPAYDSFFVNQTIQLQCSGQVGSPSAWYRWRWRRVDFNSSRGTDFQDVHFGVLEQQGPYPEGFCKYFRSSTLHLHLTKEFDGVEICCLPVRGVTQFLELQDCFYMKVKDAGCSPDCWNQGICRENVCDCPQNFRGTFCEEAVTSPPCLKGDCFDLSSSTHIVTCSSIFISVFPLIFMCYILKTLWT